MDGGFGYPWFDGEGAGWKPLRDSPAFLRGSRGLGGVAFGLGSSITIRQMVGICFGGCKPRRESTRIRGGQRRRELGIGGRLDGSQVGFGERDHLPAGLTAKP
jgi:hypothetical protein